MENTSSRIFAHWKKLALQVKAAAHLISYRPAKRRDGKIRVVFLCQYIPGWNKTLPLYRKMQADPRFQPILLCVPSGIHNQVMDDPENLQNDTYEYYIQHGYEAVNAYTGVNQWVDLKAMEPDFVFYSRPYNLYMPTQYSAWQVCRYARVCDIMYAFNIVKEMLPITLNQDFFSCCFCYFSESPDAATVNRKQFPFAHALGLQKTLYCGSMALQQIWESRSSRGSAWDFSRNAFRVMWTPRWTTDLASCGSNFFVYRDLLLDYAEHNPQVDLLLRPHPLMFENFLKTGELTREELDIYRQRVAALPNVAFDTEKEYAATFWNSSVLVSDTSGMLPEYFVTGKPLIFCASNMHLTFIDLVQEMLKGCYVVNTPEELFRCLALLEKGEDPLYDTRQTLIAKLFGENGMDNAAKITEALVKFSGRTGGRA